MDKKLSKSVKTYGLAVLIAILATIIIFSIFVSIVNKSSENNYHSMTERVCGKLVDSSYKNYVLQDVEKRNQLLEETYGIPLTDEERYREFKCRLTNTSSGVNDGPVSFSTNYGVEVSSAYRFYDSDMNSLIMDNTLFFVKKLEQDDKKVTIYYTYQDDDLAEQIRLVRNKYGSDDASLRFNVENVFVKGTEFVPAKITYSYVDENGNRSAEEALSTKVKTAKSMEEEGYEFVEVSGDFEIGDGIGSKDPDGYFNYVAEIDDIRMDRINELIGEAQKLDRNNNKETVFITKKPGGSKIEYFTLHKVTPENSDESFYAVSYEKKSFDFLFVEYLAMNKFGFLGIGLTVIGILLSFAISLVSATIYLGKSKKQQVLGVQ